MSGYDARWDASLQHHHYYQSSFRNLIDMTSKPPPLLVHVTSVPLVLWSFFAGQIAFMKRQGFVVRAISSPGEYLDRFAVREEIDVDAIEMPRRVTPVQDLISLWRMFRKLRELRPTIVHAHNPKGGLIGITAAFLARISGRVYTIHGLPYMTATGMRRRLLYWSERITCRLAQRVLCVSNSIREIAIADKLCAANKIAVLANGTCNGIDADGRFNRERQRKNQPQEPSLREPLGIPANAVVMGFVGRIVRDKGLVELVTAWQQLREDFPDLHWLVAGTFEPQDPLPADIEQTLRSDDRIHLLGMLLDPIPAYLAMDLCVLPTYREGFPYVPIEAAAMGLPVVATRVPGCIDAVVDGHTGTLVPSHDAVSLGQAIQEYVRFSALREKHGQAGRARVLSQFQPAQIWAALLNEYQHLPDVCGLPVETAKPLQKAAHYSSESVVARL